MACAQGERHSPLRFLPDLETSHYLLSRHPDPAIVPRPAQDAMHLEGHPAGARIELMVERKIEIIEPGAAAEAEPADRRSAEIICGELGKLDRGQFVVPVDHHEGVA